MAATAVFAQPGGGPGGPSGDGIWLRNAYYGELLTFDACVGHQPGNGMYHYHANPLCLRGQLNDNVQVVRSSRNGVTYRELASGWHHSPILGWALDGYDLRSVRLLRSQGPQQSDQAHQARLPFARHH